MIRKYGWTYLFLFFTVIVYFLFINSSEKNPENVLYKALRHKNAVSTIYLPQNLEFAGERVPLENFDTREMLERELIVNTYWHSQTLLLIKRSRRYFPVIDSILSIYKVPLDFKYMAVAESGLTQAVSPSQAIGFWQFLEGTARDYKLEVNDMIDERYHIEKSTEAACKYILESYTKFGSWTMAAAAYNAGRKFLSSQVEIQKQTNYYDLLLGEEAERYVFRILALKMVLENPNDYGFVTGNLGYDPIPHFKINIDKEIDDFAEFAHQYNTNYKILKMLNPWLRKPYLKIIDNKSYILKIPVQGYRSAGLYELDTIRNNDSINN